MLLFASRRAMAAWTRAAWVRAGVVAQVLVGGGVHLLGVQPERAGQREELAKQASAWRTRPLRARAWTSQNEHGRKAPSVPGSPSRPGG